MDTEQKITFWVHVIIAVFAVLFGIYIWQRTHSVFDAVLLVGMVLFIMVLKAVLRRTRW